MNARSTLDTLRNVADWFGGVHGRRKTILFVSEGIDYDINDVFNNQGALVDHRRHARRGGGGDQGERQPSTASIRAA